jgi:hypothetical protein
LNIAWLHRLDTPWATLAAAGALYGFFLLALLISRDFVPGRFVVAGDRYSAPSLEAQGIPVLPDSDGYDGQFYYAMARDPWRLVLSETEPGAAWPVQLDRPAYRLQRPGYPLLCWLLSFGQVAWLPTVMIGVNGLALLGIGALGGWIARAAGQHALWGLLLVAYPGLALALARDLAEPVEIFFVLAAYVCLRRDRALAAGVLLAAAVVTRETALGVVAALALHAVVERRKTGHASAGWWAWIGLPLVAFVLVQIQVLVWSGAIGVRAGALNLGLPGQGVIHAFGAALAECPAAMQVLALVLLAFLVVFTVLVTMALRRAPVESFVKLGWLAYTALAVCLNHAVWCEPWAFARALSEGYVLGALVLLASATRYRITLAALLVLVWGAMAVAVR